MNVSPSPSLGRLPPEPAPLTEARTRLEAARQEFEPLDRQLDSSLAGLNQAGLERAQVDGAITRQWKVRSKLPYLGMGSFMVGMPMINIGLSMRSPVMMGIGLAGLVACAGCIVAIETYKARYRKLDAERNQLTQRYHQLDSRHEQLRRTHAQAAAKLQTAQSAYDFENQNWQTAVQEARKLLQPDRGEAVSLRGEDVLVGGVRLPRRDELVAEGAD